VIAWRKSSFSDTASSCVEVRRESDVVYVRDSKLGDHSPIQEWPVEDWLFLTDAIASKQPKFSGYRKLDDGGIRLGWARLGHSPLWFNAGEWLAFEYGVRAGELDPETLSSPVAASRGGEPAAGRPVGSDTADGSGHAAAGAGITGRDTPVPVAAQKPLADAAWSRELVASRPLDGAASADGSGLRPSPATGAGEVGATSSRPAPIAAELGSLDDELDTLISPGSCGCTEMVADAACTEHGMKAFLRALLSIEDSPAGRDPSGVIATTVDSPGAVATTVQPGSDAAGAGVPPDLVPAARPGVVLYEDEHSDRSRGMKCGQCNQYTGNSNQGHYWKYCQVTRRMETFHFCCPDACDRADAWRYQYECLAERLRDLGIEPDMNNAYGVRVKTDERWLTLLAAAKAIDNDAEAWARAVAPLVSPDGAL
jgi:hypothetical protein